MLMTSNKGGISMEFDKPPIARSLSRMERRRREQARPHHYRIRWGRTARAAGWLLVVVGALMMIRIPFFYLRSWWVGSHLANTALSSTSKRANGGQHFTAWPTSVQSVLEIPKLGLAAPVLEGTLDPQLNVAVGHLPSSVSPGEAGTSILAAHNATWFRHINRLKPGNLITVVERHHTLTFQVTRSAVVHVGTPVYNSTNPSIVLEACYPLNVLYLTPYRYLVWANLVSSKRMTQGQPVVPPNTQYTPVGIPSAVAAQGLTLATNPMPMGTLTIDGRPSPAWRQSNAPLNAADATTTLYFAMLHIAEANNPTWWQEIAPNIPFSTIEPLISGQISRYLRASNEYETATSRGVTETDLQAEIQVNSPSGSSDYLVTMRTRVSGNHVSLASLTLQTIN